MTGLSFVMTSHFLSRLATPLKISFRGNDSQRQPSQQPCYSEVRRQHEWQYDAEIVTIGRKVNGALGQRDIQRDVGMLFPEPCDQRREPGQSSRRMSDQAQYARWHPAVAHC